VPFLVYFRVFKNEKEILKVVPYDEAPECRVKNPKDECPLFEQPKVAKYQGDASHLFGRRSICISGLRPQPTASAVEVIKISSFKFGEAHAGHETRSRGLTWYIEFIICTLYYQISGLVCCILDKSVV
jgi:hypothetical protein